MTGEEAVMDRSMPGWGHGRIIVGYDGSDEAKHALEWAVQVCARLDATLGIVHAWHRPPMGAWAAEGTGNGVRHAAEAVVAEGVVLASALDASVSVKGEEVESHSAAGALVNASEDADLLVVGSRGREGFTGLLLGSVGHATAAHAHCPVVIVRRSEH